MSPSPRSKFKQEKSDWFQCLNCQLILNSKDLIIHNDICEDMSLGLQTGRNFECKHGFIKNDVLCALLSDIIPKVGDVLKDVPVQIRKSLVLIHPTTMKFCKIGIGDYVLVNYEDFEFICIAWPSQSVNPGSVYIVNIPPTKTKNIVLLQRYNGHLSQAIELTINISSDISNNENLICQQFTLQNGNSCVRPGSKLSCNYFGSQVDCVVLTVFDSIKIHQQSDTCTSKIVAMMNNLSISNVFHPELDENQIMESPKSNQNLLKNFHVAQPTKSLKHNSTKDCSYFMITSETKIKLQQTQKEVIRVKQILFESVGGLHKELKLLQSQINLFISNTNRLALFGLNVPRGVILFGATGTGKTMILKALLNELNDNLINFVWLNPLELNCKHYGESEQKLKECIEDVLRKVPCVLIIESIDFICSKGKSQTSDTDRRITSALLHQIDHLRTIDAKVLILYTTNNLDDLDLALRQPGRIDKEIEIPVPNLEGRIDILRKQLVDIPHCLSEEDIKSIAENLHSFTGADIASLIQEAAVIGSTNVTSATIKIEREHMMAATQKIKPTVMREVSIEISKVLWSDIGGMENVKQRLRQAIEWPLKHPKSFKRLGVKPPRGLLMYGPPGCSKTMIAKALATESGLNFLAIKGPELFNKWVGESERAVRELFRKAKAATPSIVFFDEIDALAGSRGSSSSGGSNVGNRVLAQLLTEIDGIECLEGVTIIAATNRPDMIDKALLRPGRLDSIVYVPLPDDKTRKQIFEIQFSKMPIAFVEIEHLVKATEGYSGAELVALCQEAGLAALTDDLDSKEINSLHFEKALAYIKPRTSKETLQFYQEYYDKNNVEVKKLN